MWNNEFWDKTWSRPYGRYNRHHQEIWEAVLPLVKGKVLDLGCGPCVIWKDKNVDLTGVDWSAKALIEARKNCPLAKLIHRPILDNGLEKGYNTIVMLGVLDYFKDWTPVIAEAERLLNPGGQIIATLLNGFLGHDWTKYKKITGNWYLLTWG